MAKIFVNQIKLGNITIEEVPPKWWDAVRVLLNDDT